MQSIIQHLDKTATDIDSVTLSYQLPQLLVTLNNLISQNPDDTTQESALYEYFTQVMAGQIRQAETANIRAGVAPELVDKNNRHQITFIQNGLSITKNDDGTQTAHVKMALRDYNAFEDPQNLLENVLSDFIMPQGIAKLMAKELPEYALKSPKAVISSRYPDVTKFYTENKQALTAITLLSKNIPNYQNILQTWLEDTHQVYKSGGFKDIKATTTKLRPATISLFIGQLKTDKIMPDKLGW